MVTFVVRLHLPELLGAAEPPGAVELCGVVEEVATGHTATVRCGADLLDVLATAIADAAAATTGHATRSPSRTEEMT